MKAINKILALMALAGGLGCAEEPEPLCADRTIDPTQDLSIDILGDWRTDFDKGASYTRFVNGKEQVTFVMPDDTMQQELPKPYKITYWPIEGGGEYQILEVSREYTRTEPGYLQFSDLRLNAVTCPDSVFDLESGSGETDQ